MSAVPEARSLLRELAHRRALVDRELEAIAAGVEGDGTVAGAARYALGTGGKRLRPILCLAAADAIRVATAAELPCRARAAAAIELVHTYSLVHDDLPCMDDDDLRRGRPTTHREYGTAAAAVAGFALIPLAARSLFAAAAALDLPAGHATAVVRELCRGAGAAGMVGGQLLDLEAEGADVPLERLRAIHVLKTGALFQASLRIGGLLAAAPDPAVEALGRFGSRLGLAFQITDDVLDDTMDAAALGKTPGKDRDARKSTFAALLGVRLARAAARAEAEDAVAGLRAASIHSPFLEELARFAVDRDR